MVTDLLTEPTVAAVVTAVIVAIVTWQRSLSWHEYRAIHQAKVRVFPTLDRLAPFGFDSFVNDKQAPDADQEFITTVDAPVREVFDRLRASGGSPHLVASVKRRPGPEYSAAHVVWDHTPDALTGKQTEAYLFAGEDGTDVYAHFETQVTDPEGHLSDQQQDSDPRGVVRAALVLT